MVWIAARHDECFHVRTVSRASWSCEAREERRANGQSRVRTQRGTPQRQNRRKARKPKGSLSLSLSASLYPSPCPCFSSEYNSHLVVCRASFPEGLLTPFTQARRGLVRLLHVHQRGEVRVAIRAPGVQEQTNARWVLGGKEVVQATHGEDVRVDVDQALGIPVRNHVKELGPRQLHVHPGRTAAVLERYCLVLRRVVPARLPFKEVVPVRHHVDPPLVLALQPHQAHAETQQVDLAPLPIADVGQAVQALRGHRFALSLLHPERGVLHLPVKGSHDLEAQQHAGQGED
mmetsp:Transcript_3892/g.11695  ORF Transcript_3892/g.11695 Transcript_3892/m.11695 type:complete len:289 (+) Transcript_3892:294-1160(+)